MKFHLSARQKEEALGSITEVVQTVKRPQSHTRALSLDTTNKLEENEKFNLDYALPASSENGKKITPDRQNPQVGYGGEMSVQEAGKNSRKSGRNSLMG